MARRADRAPRSRASAAEPALRAGVITDNGGPSSTCTAWRSPIRRRSRREINQWPGVVCVGIFARNRATVCLLGTAEGVRTLTF